MRYSYVLPAPNNDADWTAFETSLAQMRQSGHDAVELQVADPAELDAARLARSLRRFRYALCAFQTGGTYATKGNCLCTADHRIRQRTLQLLKRHVDFAADFQPAVEGHPVVVFGSLQGGLKDEPNLNAGRLRIHEAVEEIGRYASERGVTVAFEPVNHIEIGFHNTLCEVESVVRRLRLPGLKMMADTFHMNIEEKDMLAPLAGVRDILAHVHLSETNRDILCAGHWPTGAFLNELKRIGYGGFCSVGVYHTKLEPRECIARSMDTLRLARRGEA